MQKKFAGYQKSCTFAPQSTSNGALAQLVEQRTENPCVRGSIPRVGTNKKKKDSKKLLSFFMYKIVIFVKLSVLNIKIILNNIEKRMEKNSII